MPDPSTSRYFKPDHVSAFRILAAITWDAPTDPTIYGMTDIDVSALGPWLERKRAETGQKLTYTHAVARAMAMVLRSYPGLNCMIRRGAIWQRRDVDVFLQVAVPSEKAGQVQGADLSGAIIRQADTKKIEDIGRELAEKAAKIRARQDPELAQIKSIIARIPPFIAKKVMRLLAWLNLDWGIDLRWTGMPDDPFGSLMVTSLGMHGIRYAYAPLFTNARSVGVVLVGGVYDAAVVRDGQIVIRPLLPLSLAADHRVIDGFQASILARECIKILENPELLDQEPQPAN
ncbi:MAG: 2-oxo acid dehydrogenase subunit E2 [Deltaproteobacteria bacterium]|nr:2-oxo acid dehydrogenase subunit E2 [Deltaproteobacteria bacterium]